MSKVLAESKVPRAVKDPGACRATKESLETRAVVAQPAPKAGTEKRVIQACRESLAHPVPRALLAAPDHVEHLASRALLAPREILDRADPTACQVRLDLRVLEARPVLLEWSDLQDQQDVLDHLASAVNVVRLVIQVHLEMWAQWGYLDPTGRPVSKVLPAKEVLLDQEVHEVIRESPAQRAKKGHRERRETKARRERAALQVARDPEEAPALLVLTVTLA